MASRMAARQTQQTSGRRRRRSPPTSVEDLLSVLQATHDEHRQPLYARLAEHGDDAVTHIARLTRDATSVCRGRGWAPTDILLFLGRRRSGLHGGLAAYSMTQDNALLAAAETDDGWAEELQSCVDVAIPPVLSTLRPAVETLTEVMRLSQPDFTGVVDN